MKIQSLSLPLLAIVLGALLLGSCLSQGAARAEEYFAIGMAYFEMGRFTEAEQWLHRARVADRTMVASEYNLGRIAFETRRYEEAARHFERILVLDRENVMALEAAAYSRIMNGDLDQAVSLYTRVLALVPESFDNGFNYALVLYSMDRFLEAQEVLEGFPHALEENVPSMLLYARVLGAQDRVEAVDAYARWVLAASPPGPQGLFEYAQALEAAGLYARALETYDLSLEALSQDLPALGRADVRFHRARLLILADGENPEGLRELGAAISEGFSDTGALEELSRDLRVSPLNREEIRRLSTQGAL